VLQYLSQVKKNYSSKKAKRSGNLQTFVRKEICSSDQESGELWEQLHFLYQGDQDGKSAPITIRKGEDPLEDLETHAAKGTMCTTCGCPSCHTDK
jgi:hypothetical protein